VPSRSIWSEIAPWYDALLASGSGPHETALGVLLALVPTPITGTSVLDLACGQGLATRALADLDPEAVLGVDASDGMIALARDTPTRRRRSVGGLTMPKCWTAARTRALTGSRVSSG
jgi:ubiquinone/menaquinone biosynthesis C-methylase UbiE